MQCDKNLQKHGKSSEQEDYREIVEIGKIELSDTRFPAFSIVRDRF